MRLYTTVLFSLFFSVLFAQTNMGTSDPVVREILKGNYDPADYAATNVLSHPDDIIPAINASVNPDSLKSYLFQLSSFENRNTGSDTLSGDFGIGAARRWVLHQFENFSAQNEGRLLPFFFQFDQNICGMGRHKNTCAVLPGADISDPSVIIIEAHLDSRCAGLCDVECMAHGMEDNGSGVALVLELARVMSRFTFDHTLVFMATTGEEQGLYGANAFAQYCLNEGIAVKAVLNNDVIGGIICGETSSPPSCPGLNDIDSTQVRLFSSGGLNKQLSRFIKLEYQEALEPLVSVPMMLTIMSAEDRQGRGGDHIPFRQKGFPAMRFTSANEHGNANVSDPDYHDRQHTSGDVLGADTDGDGVIDSFYVDMNYLARNAVINGVGAAMAAIGPETPDFSGEKFADSLRVIIDDPHNYNHYRIFARTNQQDFDTIYTLTDAKELVIKRVTGGAVLFRVSVASVDENGIESLFSKEQFAFPTVNATGEVVNDSPTETPDPGPVELFQNRPNPFDEATVISYFVHDNTGLSDAWLVVSDLNGREVSRLPAPLQKGLNEVVYTHGYNAVGTYVYSLVTGNGRVLASRTMVFAN
ncbi:MAG: M28 family peptidase [Bacteroidetes bacterium]|nr:MAG: M28 family peptidase [Bacteroidota bacterium]